MKKSVAICVTNDTFRDQRIQRVAHHLSQKGYKVTLIGTYQGKDVKSSGSYNVLLLHPIKATGPIFYIHYNLLLRKYLNQHKYDYIIACDPDTLLGTYSAVKNDNAIGIYDSHEYFIESPELVHRPVVRWIWDRIERKYTSPFQHFMTVNTVLAERLTHRLGKTFISLRNLPSLDHKLSIPTSSKDNIILYQGMLNIGRGLEEAIKMMSYLPPYFQLHIVGDGILRQKLELKASQSPAANRIQFMGMISPAELGNYTHKAKIGLNLLQDLGLNYKYSLANKFFDYMMHGVPSLNTNFSMYEYYCSNYGIGEVVETLEPKVIAKKILNMIKVENYSLLVQNCIKAREELNWELEAKKLDQIFNYLL